MKPLRFARPLKKGILKTGKETQEHQRGEHYINGVMRLESKKNW